MQTLTSPIIETHSHQMFPRLEASEIERVRRFGQVRRFEPGDALAKVGEVAPGLIVIQAGKVDVTRRDSSGARARIIIHETGSFMGELAQLAGRPDAHAQEPVEALIIRPHRLRALLIAEAAPAPPRWSIRVPRVRPRGCRPVRGRPRSAPACKHGAVCGAAVSAGELAPIRIDAPCVRTRRQQDASAYR